MSDCFCNLYGILFMSGLQYYYSVWGAYLQVKIILGSFFNPFSLSVLLILTSNKNKPIQILSQEGPLQQLVFTVHERIAQSLIL